MALKGIRVVDVSTGVAGPLAAMLLADFGAEVVKVEPPGGDPGRAEPGFAVWNRNKRSVVLDLGADAGCRRLADLLAGADVCVSSCCQADAEGTPLDQAVVTAANPGLVYLSTPPYTAARPPWHGGVESNGLLSAVTGVALRQSSFDGGPVDCVYPLLLYEQGIWAAAAAAAALVERDRSGLGQVVTVGGLHGMMVAATTVLVLDPAQAPRSTAVGPAGPNPWYGPYACADGRWLFLGALTPKFQARALDVLGLGDLLSDPRLGGVARNLILPANREWGRERIARAFATRPRDEWLEALAAADCPAGPLRDREGWLDEPQLRAIGMRVELDDPERGRVVMPGVPLVLTATPGGVRTPAPRLGEHSADLPAWSAQSLPPRGGGGPEGRRGGSGPLAGYRVLDLGSILAGPYSGSLLADLGADVIKVEPPAGDSFRELGFTYNRGMRGLAIDLGADSGREAFYRLVRSADVVIDNYRRGVLGRLGVDYESLAAVNPRIVAMSITGFGEGGPLSSEPGFDPILQGMSGMMSAQGGDSDPVFHTIAVNDVTAAALAVLGVCLALRHRERTGKGQRVWTSLAGIAAFMQSGELVRFAGRPPAALGSRDHRGPSALDRFHPVSDGWVRLQARDGDALAPLGLGEEEELPGWLAARSRDQAVRELTEAGIPAAAARRLTELPWDAELVAAEAVHLQRRADGSPYYTAGRYALFSRTRQTAVLTPPGLGEHSREVLTEAGLDGPAIDDLVARKVVVEGGPMELTEFFAYR